MRTTTRVGAGALGAALASGALLTSGVGSAFAQTPAPCDPTKYPPVQCEVVGGNQAGNPPLVADKTIGAPGAPVGVTASSGCNPGTTVTLALLRIATSGEPVVVGTTTANADGGFDISSAIPRDTAPGVYILYTTCQIGDVTSVTTTSFVVIAPPTFSGSSTTTSSAATTGSDAATSDAVATEAALRTADVPEAWVAPATWKASAEVRSAVTRAVNLRLTALRTSLPATPAQADAVAAPGRDAGSPTDTTLWYAGGAAAAFLLLGAAGWRRHVAASATTDEVAQ